MQMKIQNQKNSFKNISSQSQKQEIKDIFNPSLKQQHQSLQKVTKIPERLKIQIENQFKTYKQIRESKKQNSKRSQENNSQTSLYNTNNDFKVPQETTRILKVSASPQTIMHSAPVSKHKISSHNSLSKEPSEIYKDESVKSRPQSVQNGNNNQYFDTSFQKERPVSSQRVDNKKKKENNKFSFITNNKQKLNKFTSFRSNIKKTAINENRQNSSKNLKQITSESKLKIQPKNRKCSALSSGDISMEDIKDYNIISEKLHQLESKIADLRSNLDIKKKNPDQNNIQKKKNLSDIDNTEWKIRLKQEVQNREKALKEKIIRENKNRQNYLNEDNITISKTEEQDIEESKNKRLKLLEKFNEIEKDILRNSASRLNFKKNIDNKNEKVIQSNTTDDQKEIISIQEMKIQMSKINETKKRLLNNERFQKTINSIKDINLRKKQNSVKDLNINEFVTRISQKSLSNIRNPMSPKTENTENSFISDLKQMKTSRNYSQFNYYLTKMLSSVLGNKQDYFSCLYRDHIQQCISASNFIKNVTPPNQEYYKEKQLNLKKYPQDLYKKTLIFDLDETLVHCNESLDLQSDIVIPIVFPNGETIKAGINLRPFLFECIKELSEIYEIIVFTASHSCYANVVLDYIDPKNQYIRHRLYREHCYQTPEGLYIKDLRIINRDLKDMIIIDNALYSFGFQLNNGLVIIPYYFEKSDFELKDLSIYLKSLSKIKDVRDEIKNQYRHEWWGSFDSAVLLVKGLFNDILRSQSQYTQIYFQ